MSGDEKGADAGWHHAHPCSEFCEVCRPTPDDTTAPAYYIEGRTYEPRLVIEDWELNFNAGSVLKYIARYLRKGSPLEDLRKARQFLDFEIERLEGE